MSSLPRRLTKLEDDLAALPPEYDAMTLGELDGFIAGVIICPEEIPAEEWLGALWRDAAEDGTPLDPAPTAALSADILDHYRRVSLELKAGEEGYAAIYYTDPDDGSLVWEPWAIGFGEAIQLRMPFWKAVGTSEKTEPEVIEAAIGLMAFVSIAHGMSPDDLSRGPQPEPAEGEDAVDFAAMVEEAGDLIPTWVETLYEWRMMLRPDPVQAPIRVVKIGRNDPCPCGSGSKYKKCCGANSQA
ncbi:MAG: UPF0149 family protein [Rhizobiaceae bacterium]|nr:UPF0149 family protein [Rhizobiaceae bacterium]